MLCKSVKAMGLLRPQVHSHHSRKALLINLVIKIALLLNNEEPYLNLITTIE